ncbi:MAG: low affinity iron permease family protein [Pyrinomonadaceae bacterium]
MVAKKNTSFFTKFSKVTAHAAVRPMTFIAALTVIVLWAVSGPLFGFSDTWQLVINTSTTIITFLMVFLIQNTQNRDATAVQLKLDELICALKEADNRFLDVEDLDDKDLDERRDKMLRLADEANDAAEEIENRAEDKTS